MNSKQSKHKCNKNKEIKTQVQQKQKKRACRFVLGRHIATNNKNKKTKRKKY